METKIEMPKARNRELWKTRNHVLEETFLVSPVVKIKVEGFTSDGRPMVEIRTWVSYDNMNGEWTAIKKGVVMDLAVAREVIKASQKAIELLEVSEGLEGVKVA